MEMLGMALLIVFGGVASIALLSAIHLLLPKPVEAAHFKIEQSLGRAFLLGLVNVVFFGAVAVLLVWLAGIIRDGWHSWTAILAVVLGLLALVIVLALAVLGLNGLTALMVLLGERIGGAKTPFWSDARGGLLLVLACLTPYLGWFVFAPFALFTAVGASLMALFQKKSKAAPEVKVK